MKLRTAKKIIANWMLGACFYSHSTLNRACAKYKQYLIKSCTRANFELEKEGVTQVRYMPYIIKQKTKCII